MDAVEISQDGIPIPGHAVETSVYGDAEICPKVEKKKKKKRKASEAGGRNFSGKYVHIHTVTVLNCDFSVAFNQGLR